MLESEKVRDRDGAVGVMETFSLKPATAHPSRGLINLLYLTPRELFKGNYLLEQQWTSLETLIPCFLKSLYEGKVDVKLHEFDKLFSGLVNIQAPDQYDVLAKTASLWYYFTRITHQSVGPRIGRFAEGMIKYWIEKSNLFDVVERDVTLSTVLKKHFGIEDMRHENKIDFFMKGRERAVFVELRMSEHTGGRTGQESLLDKFNKILDLVVSGELVAASKARGLKELRLCIAIIFNENQELIDKERKNYNAGRVRSLISYIMEDNHVWGRVANLVNKYTFCNGEHIDKSRFKKALEEKYEVCLKHCNEDFRVRLEILLGNDFFRSVLGASLHELVAKHGEVVADDLWIMYTLTLNELKIANMFGKTNPRIIYETSMNVPEIRDVFNDFQRLYEKYQRDAQLTGTLSLVDYIVHLNEVINKLAHTVLNAFSKIGHPLYLLESNNMTMAYNYLRYVCAAVLALYLTINMSNNSLSSACRW